jgi:predicted metal-dependent phosphoesterase TrpH
MMVSGKDVATASCVQSIWCILILAERSRLAGKVVSNDDGEVSVVTYRRLKADLHAHTADDPHDPLSHSAEMLIDAAAEAGVDVLAITLHESFFQCDRMTAYGRERGVLIIPGMEQLVEGKHVLFLNPDETMARCTTFAELRSCDRQNAAIIAPHPFFPTRVALGRKVDDHHDLFDAIEYSTMYCPGINFNRRASLMAQRLSLPLVGNSDTHTLPYWNATFSWIEAEPTVDSVVEALKAGRVEVDTRPLSHFQVMAFAAQMASDICRDIISARLN